MQCQKRQVQKGIPEGFINVGEDGRPYASDCFLMVADGLGGRGGFSHTKFKDRDILDSGKFYDIVMSPVLENSDEEFRQYVTDSFCELFSLKDVYFTGRPDENKRTSGYFASRFVSAIVLNTFKFNPEFDREKLFSRLLSAPDGDRTSILKEYSDLLQGIVKSKLTEIAEKNNFEIESKTTGSYLLPSTLMFAVVNEQKRYVDVVYFWAGDSRAYMWNNEGLAQVSLDHEQDETMTNLICLSKPFYLEAKYMRFEKPCILFNTTDGCYKSNCFGSPLDFEYVFLDSMKQAETPEQFSSIMTKLYKSIGSDDSDTMALATYGYKDFKEVRKAVEKRLDAIHRNIVEKLPDIFERDYAQELNEVESKIERIIRTLSESLSGNDSVHKIVLGKIEESDNAQSEKEKEEIEREERCDSELSVAKHGLLEWISGHWIDSPCLRRIAEPECSSGGGNPCAEFEKLKEETDNARKRVLQRQADVAEKARSIADAIMNRIDMDGEKGLISKVVLDQLQALDRLRDELKQLPVEVNKEKRTIQEKITEIEAFKSRQCTEDAPLMDKVAEYLISEGVCVFERNGIEMEKYEEIKPFVEIIRSVSSDKADARKKNDGHKEENLDRYLKSNGKDLFMEILEEYPELIPAEQRSSVTEYSGLNSKKKELDRCLETRNRLYEDYERCYLRYIGEN